MEYDKKNMSDYIKNIIDDVLQDKLYDHPTTYKNSSKFINDFVNGEIGIYFVGNKNRLNNFCNWLEWNLKLEYDKCVYYTGFHCWNGLIYYKEINVYNIKKWICHHNLYINIVNYEFTKYDLVPGLHICKTKNQELLYCIQNGNNETLLLYNNILISINCYDYYLNNIYNDDFTIIGVYEYINVGNKKMKLESILVGKPKKVK